MNALRFWRFFVEFQKMLHYFCNSCTRYGPTFSDAPSLSPSITQTYPMTWCARHKKRNTMDLWRKLQDSTLIWLLHFVLLFWFKPSLLSVLFRCLRFQSVYFFIWMVSLIAKEATDRLTVGEVVVAVCSLKLRNSLVMESWLLMAEVATVTEAEVLVVALQYTLLGYENTRASIRLMVV